MDQPTTTPQPADHAFKAVLKFWFGALDDQGRAAPACAKRWWTKDPEFDSLLRQLFEAEHAAIMRREREDWLGSARGRLAYIVVLDQLSRNMYRDQPQMFASDRRAVSAVLQGLYQGQDLTLATDERVFFYMPLMHSEDLGLQDRCVVLFEALRDELSGAAQEHISHNLKFAIQHREIIARWGRFPHRNAILGRASTEDELAFLKQPGSSF